MSGNSEKTFPFGLTEKEYQDLEATRVLLNYLFSMTSGHEEQAASRNMRETLKALLEEDAFQVDSMSEDVVKTSLAMIAKEEITHLSLSHIGDLLDENTMIIVMMIKKGVNLPHQTDVS
jgi:hypothetical protein